MGGAALAAGAESARVCSGVAAFAIVAAGAAALDWVATAVLTWRLVPPDAMLFQAVLSAALYPVLAILFARRIGRSPPGAGVMRPQQGQDSALKPARGFAPGPPAKAEPLQSIRLEWLVGKGVCVAAGCPTTGRAASRDAYPLPDQPLQVTGSKGCALGEDPRAEPLGGFRAKPLTLAGTAPCAVTRAAPASSPAAPCS